MTLKYASLDRCLSYILCSLRVLTYGEKAVGLVPKDIPFIGAQQSFTVIHNLQLPKPSPEGGAQVLSEPPLHPWPLPSACK